MRLAARGPRRRQARSSPRLVLTERAAAEPRQKVPPEHRRVGERRGEFRKMSEADGRGDVLRHPVGPPDAWLLFSGARRPVSWWTWSTVGGSIASRLRGGAALEQT